MYGLGIGINFVAGASTGETDSRIAFVITDNGEEISKTLVSTSPRDVTLIDVKGVYTYSKKQMLFCALKESKGEEFQNKILLIDKNAFIVFLSCRELKETGFIYTSR